MLRVLVFTLIALFLGGFFIGTAKGRSIMAVIRSFVSWLWLTRVSVLGLLLMLAVPILARDSARSLLIGVYDLHGDNRPGLIGVFCAGVLLAFGAWTVFVTAAITLAYGKQRTGFLDDPPTWSLPVIRILAFAAIGINAWTAIAATDPRDRGNVTLVLVAGLAVGLVGVWLVEEVHRRLTPFPMKRYHLLAHSAGVPTDHPGEPGEGFLQNLRLDEKVQRDLRGYVGTHGERSFLLPGHGIAGLATVVFGLGMYIPISIFLNPDGQLTALVYLLVSLITWAWVLSGITFFFDAYRIPVFAPILLWLVAATWSQRSDHFYRIWPASETVAEARAAGEKARAPLRELEMSPLEPKDILYNAEMSGRRIVLIAAAGGGIQSAAWTAKVLSELERIAGKTEPGCFARSVQMMSGVSGGSTGIMFFAQAYGPSGFAGPRTSEPPRAYPGKLLEDIVTAASATSLGQTTWGYAYPDLGRSYFPFYINNPFRDRGEAMEKAWAYNARQFMESAGEGLGPASLREWQADAHTGLRPAMIFNATIVERGDRMSFSTAPPIKGVEGRCEFWAPSRRDERDVHAANFLYPGADIRITTAVRLSATFPLVSPSARPGIARSRDASQLLDPVGEIARGLAPGASGKLHLADGGYYENSALSDLSQWLDKGLSRLCEKRQPVPTEVLVIQIEAFPENEVRIDPNHPRPPEVQRRNERGALFQVFAPVVTLNSVRNSGHTAFANYDFALLQHRWRLDAQPVMIRHVRFVLPPMKSPATAGSKSVLSWSAWADAKTDQPPLSWHLREPEKQAIHDAWKQLVSERQLDSNGMPVEPSEPEWSDTKSRPIDKVLSFLSTPAPPRRMPIAEQVQTGSSGLVR